MESKGYTAVRKTQHSSCFSPTLLSEGRNVEEKSGFTSQVPGVGVQADNLPQEHPGAAGVSGLWDIASPTDTSHTLGTMSELHVHPRIQCAPRFVFKLILLTDFLRYNLYTIKLTHLMHTNQ